MDFAFSPLAQTYAPWSISKLGVANNCGKQFEFKHVLKHEEISISSDNQVGLAAHCVLEHALRGLPLREAHSLALEKYRLMSRHEEELQCLMDAIEEFLRKVDIFCKQNGPVTRLIEEKWGLTIDGRGTAFDAPDVFFRGVVDLGLLTRDNDLIVIDHKAGKPYGLKKYQAQLNSYAVLGRANRGDIHGVRAAIHYLRENPHERLQWCRYVNEAYIETTLRPWLFEYINSIAAELDGFIAKPGLRWPCQWCAYHPVCPDFQELKNAAQG